ncbi:MAG TPA: hypothetical protein VKA32_00515 [Gammaproteobacteria bacterium]|nr:hypothetical protein [Gammaproteobacteria bacterium]
MQIQCPTCHSRFSLDQATEDESARRLMAILGELPREVSAPLVAYLGLFRSRTRALAWERSLRLAREVLELGRDTMAIGAALSETVEAMRGKQGADWKPLTNHNYLKRVLESTMARGGSAPARVDQPRPPRTSNTARSLQALEDGDEQYRLGE